MTIMSTVGKADSTMITRGFRRRRDYEAKQELRAHDEEEDVEERAENPERPAERQTPPDKDTQENQTLFTRIWRSLRGQ